MKIAVLITCHNRKEKTVNCLGALFSCRLPVGCHIEVILVDDGSTDGTSEAVAEKFPQVIISRGNGSLFWNRGMHAAQTIARGMSADFHLWLNDDTVLFSDAVVKLISTYKTIRHGGDVEPVVVGTTIDPADGRLTYGGAVSRSKFRRFSYVRVWDEESAVECEVMNGNVVLIPRLIVESLVAVDPVFEHAMGDTDYALRARASGYKVFVAPGVTGECAANPAPGVSFGAEDSLAKKWRHFTSRKGLPQASWLHFTKRHGGILWFVYFVQPYARFWGRMVVSAFTRQLSSRVGSAP